MLQDPCPEPKIPTKNPQPARAEARRAAGRARGGPRSRRTPRPGVLQLGDARAATRGAGRVVVELECGITVYPAREEGDRWRAVWKEDGARRQCEAATEEKLAAKLAKVTERLTADAPNLERPGADLIAYYLSPGRHPASQAVVGQARRHPAAAVRAVRSPGHHRHHLPGHQGRRHAEGGQRRAHRGRGRPAAPVPVGHGHGGNPGRVPDQPAAAGSLLAGRGPARARPAGQRAGRVRAVRRPRPDPRRR